MLHAIKTANITFELSRMADNIREQTEFEIIELKKKYSNNPYVQNMG
jgi:hypothetical protein